VPSDLENVLALLTRRDKEAMRQMIDALASGDERLIDTIVVPTVIEVSDITDYLDELGIRFGRLQPQFLDYAYVFKKAEGDYQIEFPLWDGEHKQSDAWAYFVFDPSLAVNRVTLNYIREP
jgi:hypothetical protein